MDYSATTNVTVPHSNHGGTDADAASQGGGAATVGGRGTPSPLSPGLEPQHPAAARGGGGSSRSRTHFEHDGLDASSRPTNAAVMRTIESRGEHLSPRDMELALGDDGTLGTDGTNSLRQRVTQATSEANTPLTDGDIEYLADTIERKCSKQGGGLKLRFANQFPDQGSFREQIEKNLSDNEGKLGKQYRGLVLQLASDPSDHTAKDKIEKLFESITTPGTLNMIDKVGADTRQRVSDLLHTDKKGLEISDFNPLSDWGVSTDKTINSILRTVESITNKIVTITGPLFHFIGKCLTLVGIKLANLAQDFRLGNAHIPYGTDRKIGNVLSRFLAVVTAATVGAAVTTLLGSAFVAKIVVKALGITALALGAAALTLCRAVTTAILFCLPVPGKGINKLISLTSGGFVEKNGLNRLLNAGVAFNNNRVANNARTARSNECNNILITSATDSASDQASLGELNAAILNKSNARDLAQGVLASYTTGEEQLEANPNFQALIQGLGVEGQVVGLKETAQGALDAHNAALGALEQQKGALEAHMAGNRPRHKALADAKRALVDVRHLGVTKLHGDTYIHSIITRLKTCETEDHAGLLGELATRIAEIQAHVPEGLIEARDTLKAILNDDGFAAEDDIGGADKPVLDGLDTCSTYADLAAAAKQIAETFSEPRMQDMPENPGGSYGGGASTKTGRFNANPATSDQKALMGKFKNAAKKLEKLDPHYEDIESRLELPGHHVIETEEEAEAIMNRATRLFGVGGNGERTALLSRVDSEVAQPEANPAQQPTTVRSPQDRGLGGGEVNADSLFGDDDDDGEVADSSANPGADAASPVQNDDPAMAMAVASLVASGGDDDQTDGL